MHARAVPSQNYNRPAEVPVVLLREVLTGCGQVRWLAASCSAKEAVFTSSLLCVALLCL